MPERQTQTQTQASSMSVGTQDTASVRSKRRYASFIVDEKRKTLFKVRARARPS